MWFLENSKRTGDSTPQNEGIKNNSNFDRDENALDEDSINLDSSGEGDGSFDNPDYQISLTPFSKRISSIRPNKANQSIDDPANILELENPIF